MAASSGEGYDVASLADLLVGVVPIVNLEWIQKIARDNAERGYSARSHRGHDPAPHAGLHQPHLPQFSRTDINFQRVPTVDTANPFIIRNIPTRMRAS
jgi:phosphoribulokinase